jgi:signal transduction histidine kinase
MESAGSSPPGVGPEARARSRTPTRAEASNLLLRAMSDAVLAVASEHAVEPVLQRLVHAARDLVGARYAALGIPDGSGNFARFLTSGMTDEQIARIGPLPRTHGLLGAMLSSHEPYRTRDIRTDPRFWGWPREHPTMMSFLGVPIAAKGTVTGAFYLTDKEGADEFTDDDQELIEMLAAHAAVAIENARLYERSRELSVVEERNRLARDLHDAVVQTLFSVVLTADAAALLVDRDPAGAKLELEQLRALAHDALRELRSLVFELRPADLEAEGLTTTLRKHAEVLSRVNEVAIEVRIEGELDVDSGRAVEVFRIIQEALNNALRHASAGGVTVSVAHRDGGLVAWVTDDGIGFDPDAPGVRGRRLGLTSMEERAAALGGTLRIDSAPGRGTTVALELP